MRILTMHMYINHAVCVYVCMRSICMYAKCNDVRLLAMAMYVRVDVCLDSADGVYCSTRASTKYYDFCRGVEMCVWCGVRGEGG